MYQLKKNIFCVFLLSFMPVILHAQEIKTTVISNNGWANNSVNTVIFRKNSLATFKNTQFAAFYDGEQNVVIAKRTLNAEKWEVKTSHFKGDANDAHKSISIMVDGNGFLHIAWNQHNNQLHYAKSVSPFSLDLGDKIPMLSRQEGRVTYPEFYRIKNGDLLFFYRDGGSGNGNLVINRYDLGAAKWLRVQDNLIDGEGKRNAYWQVFADKNGGIHLSWVWRETPDVASNHDLCYAKSDDGGLTWQKSSGVKYQLPIHADNAEYALKIPMGSELINQTSMFADGDNNIFIASYWRDQLDSIPQYHVVYKTKANWAVKNLAFRKTPFSLNGVGTKKIPISRPQIIAFTNRKKLSVGIVFRDEERGSKVSIAWNKDIKSSPWEIKDLSAVSVGDWEPSYDTERWKNQNILSLFVQQVKQVDGEGKANQSATAVRVLEWKPRKN